MIKVREVRIAIEVKRIDAGDVSPVAMFFKRSGFKDIKYGILTGEPVSFLLVNQKVTTGHINDVTPF